MGWNKAARGVPFVILTDLDRYPCPSALIQEWIPRHRHPNLLLRVAVREVEAWLLADAANLAAFLRIRPQVIPPDPDSLQDAKAVLVGAASQSRSQEVRRRVAPKRGSTAKQGPEYNACLGDFGRHSWDVDSASSKSSSLHRTLTRLQSFTPIWGTTQPGEPR